MPNPKEVFEDPLKFIEFLTSASDDRFESQHFDRKEACRIDEHGNVSQGELKGMRDHIISTVSAFANKNKEGGLLVLGIDSNGNVIGTDHLSENALNSFVNFNTLLRHQRAQADFFELQDSHGNIQKICLIYAPYNSNAICETPGNPPKAWVRQSRQNLPLSRELREQLERDKGIVRFELSPCCPFDIQELNTDVLDKFKEAWFEQRGNIDRTDEQILLNEGAIIRDGSGNFYFTNAGYLFFGINPQSHLDWAYIRLLRFESSYTELHNRGLPTNKPKEFRGSLTQQIRQIRSFLKDSAFFKSYTRRNPQGGGFIEEPEYPHGALDEAIVNAVAHRDYATQQPILIESYKDGLIIKNSGTIEQPDRDLPEKFSLADTFLESKPRNSKIIEWLKMMPSEQGTPFVFAVAEGTNTMRREMENLNLPAPIFKISSMQTSILLINNAEERESLMRGETSEREDVRQLRDYAKEESDDELNTKAPPINSKGALKNHFNVPFASKGDAFVGREGLREKIWESLNRSGRAAIGQAVSIKGIGGLGKTQLAVEYAHAYRSRYENGVFWLTADEDINIQLIKIGEDLNWISQFDTGFDQAELVRNRFRKLSDCLIIFDNVDDQRAIENYLPESDARPHILITSREKQELFDEINLDVLSRDESRKLLLEVSARSLAGETEEKALEKILEELGDLPLAVELVGGFLAEHQIISFREYLDFLDEVPLDALEDNFPSISFTHHDKSIIRTLRISEKVLRKKPYLEEILDILAWSGKSSMGYSLLQSLTGIENNYTLTTALSDLVNLRLIKEEKEAKRYTIHRLVARVRQFEKPLAERKEWHQKIVAKLVEWFRQRKDEFEYLTEFENEMIHLQQWQLQSVDVLPIETVYLINFESYPLWHRGNYRESKALLEKALNLYQENQLNDEKLLANLYNDLGVIIGNLGNLNKEFEFKQKALSIGRNVFDEKSADIAKFLNSLGSSYDKLGNHQKALELKEQALKMRQELFGEKHPDIAQSLSNLGLTYNYLGNHQKALELNEQALKIQQELFGVNHPAIAMSLNNLAYSYSDLGNQQKALELHEQALKIRQELFGEKHSDIAMSLNNLGYIHDQLNNKQKAINFYESALKMRREILGERHPDTISSSGNLIQTLSELGKREQAGRLAGEFLSYVPQNHSERWLFEKYGAAYRKAHKKKKRRRN